MTSRFYHRIKKFTLLLLVVFLCMQLKYSFGSGPPPPPPPHTEGDLPVGGGAAIGEGLLFTVLLAIGYGANRKYLFKKEDDPEQNNK